jgi:hypothetical protein
VSSRIGRKWPGRGSIFAAERGAKWCRRTAQNIVARELFDARGKRRVYVSMGTVVSGRGPRPELLRPVHRRLRGPRRLRTPNVGGCLGPVERGTSSRPIRRPRCASVFTSRRRERSDGNDGSMGSVPDRQLRGNVGIRSLRHFARLESESLRARWFSSRRSLCVPSTARVIACGPTACNVLSETCLACPDSEFRPPRWKSDDLTRAWGTQQYGAPRPTWPCTSSQRFRPCLAL